MISGALHCTAKELRIALRDPWAIVMWLIVPLTVGAMVTAISGPGNATPTAQLLVVDEDDSFLSQLVISALGQEQISELIAVSNVERQEGNALIDNGEGSALLVIPEGFGYAVLREEPTELTLLTNPAQRILPVIIAETLSVLTDGVFYVQRVFGKQIAVVIEQIDAAGDSDSQLFSDLQIAALSVSLNAAVESVVENLDPPALALAESGPAQEDGGTSYALLFFPSVLFMGLLFASQGLSNSFWRERMQGTLRRSVVSPLSLTEIFAGKILAGAAMLFLLTAFMTAIGFLYHGLSPMRWLPGILWLTLSGLVLFGLMALLQLLAPSQKSASVFTNMAVYPLMMAGGAFFPFEAMPDWLSAIGRWVPNGFLLERFKAYLVYDGGLAALGNASFYAFAMAAILWSLCAWRLRGFAGASG